MDNEEGTRRWRFGLAEASLGLVACAAVMGWAASFVGLHDFGVHSMHGYSDFTAWFVPATFDGAAFGTTLITYRASINGRGAFRARVLMWAFTAVSSWINWVHQPSPKAQIVAAGLPIAAVAVFDVVMLEMRGDYEARHGRRAFRMRPGLLLLRWMVDRTGTAEAFREQIRSIPVASLAGLGSDLAKLRATSVDAPEDRTEPAGPPATPPTWPRTEENSSLSAAAQPWPASWPQPQGGDQQIPHAVNGTATTSAAEVGRFARRAARAARVERASDTTEVPAATAHTPTSPAAERTEHVDLAEVRTTRTGAERVQPPEFAAPTGDTTGAPGHTKHTPTSRPSEPTKDVPLAEAHTRKPEEPAEQTIVLPAMSVSAVREAARAEVRDALTAGKEPPAKDELADRYVRSKRWAHELIKEVRQELEKDSPRQLAGADRRR